MDNILEKSIDVTCEDFLKGVFDDVCSEISALEVSN